MATWDTARLGRDLWLWEGGSGWMMVKAGLDILVKGYFTVKLQGVSVHIVSQVRG